MSLTPDVTAAVNQQIANEMYGAYVYLALAAHFQALALDGFAAWMRGQSGEEIQHAEKLIRFLRDNDEHIVYGPIPAPPASFDGVHGALATVLEIEQRNTRQIHEIYHLANRSAVHSVEVLMRWFIEQQGIEEKFARQAIARVELAGDDHAALLVLDSQFAQAQVA